MFIGHHTDGTNRRDIEFQNNIIRIAKDGGFKNVMLDSCIVTPGDLKTFGRIDLQHAAAGGQSRENNDLGRDVKTMIGGRKGIKEKATKGIGVYHLMSHELQRTSILTSKFNKGSYRKEFQDRVATQFRTAQESEERVMEKS